MTAAMEVPVVVTSVAGLRGFVAALRSQRPEARVGFVPTMGALHDGHASLISTAREHAGIVVVSVFVNPTQFGPGEDFATYPRTLDADIALCARMGADIVFTPPVEEMYPVDQTVTVHAGALGEVLEGAHRPGHFNGVATVVTKLFQIVQPDVAIFGQKDAQQLAVLSAMTQQLAMPVEIVAAETVREPDGLAMSSRNRYLTPQERQWALAIPRALEAAQSAAQRGVSDMLSAAEHELSATPQVNTSYLVAVDPISFDSLPTDYSGPARVLIAARVGSTRLIDNVLVEVSAPGVAR